MRRHARDGEAPGWNGSRAPVCAGVPIGVGENCLPPDLVKRDVLRGVECGARHRHARKNGVGIGGRPFQRLHPAHRPADDGEQFPHAKMLHQKSLCPHHVADGDRRKIGAPGFARGRVDAARPGAAHAAAEHVGANDEKSVGVDRPARSDDQAPPAGLAGERMRLGDVLVASKGMADQDRVGFVRIQGAVGAVGDGDAGQGLAAVKYERRREAHLRMRMVGFGRGVVRVHGLRCIRGRDSVGKRAEAELPDAERNQDPKFSCEYGVV